MEQKVCIFTGARPNFVKVAPLIRAIETTEGISYQLVYAGTADDPSLEPTLFSDLQMPRPDVFLGVDCENLNELTGKVMATFEKYLEQHSTDTVIVVDDLASTMAAAIVAKKRGLRLAHLVAGTRSFDIHMPKEINRLVIDGLSDLLFTAGMGSSSIATREGAEISKIYMVKLSGVFFFFFQRTKISCVFLLTKFARAVRTRPH
jgi:UDP-N-acetylglucosamine 2-epimerase (non-hydrolysing)